MIVMRDGAVWLTVDEAIDIIELLKRSDVLETLDGRDRQRLQTAIKQLQEQLRTTEGPSVQLELAQLTDVLRFLTLTQHWIIKLLNWLEDVG